MTIKDLANERVRISAVIVKKPFAAKTSRDLLFIKLWANPKTYGLHPRLWLLLQLYEGQKKKKWKKHVENIKMAKFEATE